MPLSPTQPDLSLDWPMLIYLTCFLGLGLIGAIATFKIPSDPSANWRSRIFSPLAWLILLVSYFQVPGAFGLTGIGVDDSWPLVLEYAAQKRLQLGTELIFTFGPLGYLFGAQGLGGFIGERLIFAWAHSMFAAYVGWRVGSLLPWWLRLPFWGFLVFFPPTPILLTAMAACLSFHLRSFSNRWSRVEALALLANVALMALVKFTDLVAALAVLAGISLWHLSQRRWRASLALLASFASVYLLGWTLSGQALQSLPTYMVAGLQMSTGYSETMATVPEKKMLLWALALALFLLLCALGKVVQSGRRWFETAWQSAVILGCAFLSWKHAFLRADNGHVFFFTVLAFPYACLLMNLSSEGSDPHASRISNTFVKWRSALAPTAGLFVLFISLAGLALGAGRWYETSRPLSTVPQRLSASLTTRLPTLQSRLTPAGDEWSLPQTTQLVNQSRVDVINYCQNYAFINGLNYHPRPAFQSYASYTAWLHQANLRHYRSSSRPDYVLLRLGSIDERLPWLDDAPLMLDLLTSWTPKLSEKNLLILEKPQSLEPNGKWQKIHSGNASWNNEVNVPDSPSRSLIALRIDSKQSLIGKLKKFAYQPAAIRIHLSLKDGRQLDYRFLPSMATDRVLLSPCIETTEAFARWQHRQEPHSEVLSFRLVPQGSGSIEWQPEFQYHLLQWIPAGVYP